MCPQPPDGPPGALQPTATLVHPGVNFTGECLGVGLAQDEVGYKCLSNNKGNKFSMTILVVLHLIKACWLSPIGRLAYFYKRCIWFQYDTSGSCPQNVGVRVDHHSANPGAATATIDLTFLISGPVPGDVMWLSIAFSRPVQGQYEIIISTHNNSSNMLLVVVLRTCM